MSGPGRKLVALNAQKRDQEVVDAIAIALKQRYPDRRITKRQITSAALQSFYAEKTFDQIIECIDDKDLDV